MNDVAARHVQSLRKSPLWWRCIRLTCIVYGVLLMLLVVFETMLVYPVPSRSLGDWYAEAYEAEDVDFHSEDGTKLHGWYFPHPNPRAYVLFCHGNGEHMGFLGEPLAELRARLDVAIFAFDYRGYGKSGGRPFEAGVLQDGEAAQRWFAKRVDVSPEEIVVYGRSLGGAVAVHLAGTLGARGLVAERTFHSMVEIGAKQFWWAPVRWLMRNRYPSDERIKHYAGPLFQLHGSADELVPLQSAKQLFNACPSTQKVFVEVSGMGHNSPNPADFYDRLGQFFDSL